MYFSEEEVTVFFRKLNHNLVTEEESSEIINEVMKQMPSVINDFNDLSEIICNILSSSSHRNKNYDKLAVILLEDALFKKVPERFSDCVARIQENKDVLGNTKPLISESFYNYIMQNRDMIDDIFLSVTTNVPHFELTSFGLKTLARSYLLKTHEGIMEKPNHLWFRVSLFLNQGDLTSVAKSFEFFRRGYFIHATPTLYHAGLTSPQMASCYLIGTDDSVVGIFKTIGDAAQISKWAGGIGIHISNIRAKNSYIYGTNGVSNGIMPMLKVYNDTSRYIDQCFEGAVCVFSENGFIPIKDIQPGEKVLTNSGNFETVLAKNKYWKKGELLSTSMKVNNNIFTQYLTMGHEFLIKDVANAHEMHFIPFHDVKFNAKFVFTPPMNLYYLDAQFTANDCFIVGYIYRHGSLCDGGFKFTYSDMISFSINLFLNTNYPHQWKVFDNLYIVTYNEVVLPDKIDTDFLGKDDFPGYFLRLSVHKLRRFMDGWNYSGKKKCIKQMSVDFLLDNKEWNDNHQILKIEQVQEQKPIAVYDLVIENNPCYQTNIGMVHNGGGKRNGAFAMYIEPWHADIFDFVLARRNIGNEDERARDLFYGLWIPDLFMRQVENGGKWYLMSPDRCPELTDKWGTEFEEAYWSHVEKKNYHKEIHARELWVEILKSQIETGVPYILYKDSANRKSNQQNLGTIKSSNLCCEIIEYSDDKEYAVCNLASLSLPKFIKYKEDNWTSLLIYTKKNCSYCKILKSILSERGIAFIEKENDILPSFYQSFHKTFPLIIKDAKYVGGFSEFWNDYLCPQFDFDKFGDAVSVLVHNLNTVIDLNAYPLKECKESNLRHRPIGIGVQGLADLFFIMRMSYDSKEARQLNLEIFEALYFYALQASNELAKKSGHYSSFPNSPLSLGRFHFDLCENFNEKIHLSSRFDWEQLRTNIQKYGTKNSLLVAPMPTASTSQILGNTESFEPLTNNLYLRRTSAGEFYICNQFLIKDLRSLSKWDNNTIEHLIVHKGSVQQLDIPTYLKNIYRTVWEIPQKSLIDMAADRQFFIDQSQSFNIYLNDSNMDKLNKIHFYGWKKGLKTGSYYIRSRAPVSSQNYTIDPLKEKSLLACESCSG